MVNKYISKDINIGAISEAIGRKLESDTIHIIDTYTNSDSGYNIWSNGYCEQWGQVETGATVTYLKKFKDTHYVLVASGVSSSENTPLYCQFMPNSRSATGFVSTKYSGVSLNWKASGYLAEGEYTL